jgi:tRNA uridine 5-carboxymethylaminomethyl modification enzyme
MRVRQIHPKPYEAAGHGLALNRDGQRGSAFELLAYPAIGWTEIRDIWPELAAIDPSIAGRLQIDAKYDAYPKCQVANVDGFGRDEGLILTDVDYALVPGSPTRPARNCRPRGRERSGRRAGWMV